jgi:hypothetical protein
MKKIIAVFLLFLSISVSAKFYKELVVEEKVVLPEYNFYINDNLSNEIPNNDYIYIKSNCTNKTISDWDNNKWIPIMKNIESNDTKCNYYFKEKITKSLKDTDINKYISINNNIYKMIDINTLELENINNSLIDSKYVKIKEERLYLNEFTYIESGNGEENNPYIIR